MVRSAHMIDVEPKVGATRPIVLAGPTASGKSAIAMALAEALDGEIICADSRQVYAMMRIVSAGPSADDETRVRHVGYHVVDPRDTYDAGLFVRETDVRVEDAWRRGKTPILVGGTGMYLRAWRFGLGDVPDRDDVIRARLTARLDSEGLAPLFAELRAADPKTAETIGPTDPHRTIRALEVLAVTGVPPSASRQSFFASPPRYAADWILLEAEQPWLTERIAIRAAAMFEHGLVDEARALRSHVGAGHRLLATMGTEEALAFADGAVIRDAAIERSAIRQRQYARRQRIWFRKETWWTRVSAETFAQGMGAPTDADANSGIKTLLHNLTSRR